MFYQMLYYLNPTLGTWKRRREKYSEVNRQLVCAFILPFSHSLCISLSLPSHSNPLGGGWSRSWLHPPTINTWHAGWDPLERKSIPLSPFLFVCLILSIYVLQQPKKWRVFHERSFFISPPTHSFRGSLSLILPLRH